MAEKKEREIEVNILGANGDLFKHVRRVGDFGIFSLTL